MEFDGQTAAGVSNDKRPNLFNECRSWKLINDPFLKKGLPKLYRFDGTCPGNSAYNVQYLSDPRTLLPTRYWGGREQADLAVPVFQIDDNCVGQLPAREVSFFDLNDNISPVFLAELCKKCGEYEDLKIYYHPVDKRHLGIGRVIFKKVKYAKFCIDKHNGTPIMGKIVQVLLDPFGKRVKKLFHDLSTADSTPATTLKDNSIASSSTLNRTSNNSVGGSSLTSSSQHLIGDNGSVSTPHNASSIIPEDPISQQRAPIPVPPAQVYPNCSMPPVQTGYPWPQQACWPAQSTWPTAPPTWPPPLPFPANFPTFPAAPPLPQQTPPVYESADNNSRSAPQPPPCQPGVDEKNKNIKRLDAGRVNGEAHSSTYEKRPKSRDGSRTTTPDRKRSEKLSSKHHGHEISSNRKNIRDHEHQTVEKRVVRLTTKLYRTSLHRRGRSPIEERHKYLSSSSSSSSRRKDDYSKEYGYHRYNHRSINNSSRSRDDDRSSSLRRERHRSRDDRHGHVHRSESRSSSKRDFKVCDDGLESLSSDSILSDDDDDVSHKSRDKLRKEENRKSEETKNCSRRNEDTSRSRHREDRSSSSSKHRHNEVVENVEQGRSHSKKAACKTADDDDKMSLSSGSSRPSSRNAKEIQQKPNPPALPPPPPMLPGTPFCNTLPSNIYNPYDPTVYAAMMCAAMAVYGMPPAHQQQPLLAPAPPQQPQIPNPWSVPIAANYQQPPIEQPTQLPVSLDYNNPHVIRKLTVETFESVVEDLKFVLNKDIWKKLVENSAFKSLDNWFQTQEKVNDILKPKTDSPEKPVSTATTTVGSTAVSSSLSRLFGQENSTGAAGSSFSQLFGLGLRASLPKLPSFKRKPIESVPTRRHKEIEKSNDSDSVSSRKVRGPISTSSSSSSRSHSPSEKSSAEESEHEVERETRRKIHRESDSETEKDDEEEEYKPKRLIETSDEEEEEQKVDEERDDDDDDDDDESDNKSEASCSSKELKRQKALNSIKKRFVAADSSSDDDNDDDDHDDKSSRSTHAKPRPKRSSDGDDDDDDGSENEEENSSESSDETDDSCSEHAKENSEVDSDVELIVEKEIKPVQKTADQSKRRNVVTPDSSVLKDNEQKRGPTTSDNSEKDALSPKLGVYANIVEKENSMKISSQNQIQQGSETKMIVDDEYSPNLYDHCYFIPKPPQLTELSSNASVVEPVVNADVNAEAQPFNVLKLNPKKTSPQRKSANVRDILKESRTATANAAASAPEKNGLANLSFLNFSKPSAKPTKSMTPLTPARSGAQSDVLFKRRDAFAESKILYDFVSNGLDEEDIGFMKRAYELMCIDNNVTNDWLSETHWSAHIPTVSPPPCKKRRLSADERTVHKTGSARTEGFYRPTEKLKRKFTFATRRAIEESVIPPNIKADDQASKQQLQLSREARSLQRRLLNTFGDIDFLKFNQLKYRKKLIKFARSKIHGWGLFALEPIGQDEMIIEYVGEKIRLVVAEKRERHYEKMGIGSSYLFRIDNEKVIDATKRGAVARFINHSCNPSCYAKIINLDGEKRIVIYSKQSIGKGEEITYDYKFPFEDVKIPCNCGAHNCRGSLN